MQRGYTLLELLIVIGVIAILFVATVLVLNPVELLAEGRDARRLAEITSFDKAISLALTLNLGLSQGNPNTVYLSLPDVDGLADGNYLNTCNEYPNLPPLVSPWVYKCAPLATFRKIDGTGWIPINFQSLPVVPIDDLTPDPINNAARGLYYNYVPGWELNAQMESQKYQWGGNTDRESGDGGDTILLYEKGNRLTLMPAEVQARSDAPILVPTSCADTTIFPNHNSQNYEYYNRWTISGSASRVAVTKIWYWQGCTTNPAFCSSFNQLEPGEFIQMALYEDTVTSNDRRLSNIVSIEGTGTGTTPFSIWSSGAISSPVEVASLNGTFVIGIGPGDSTGNGYSVNDEINGLCANYLPNVSPSSYLENPTDGILGDTVQGVGLGQQITIVGISYAEN